MAKDIARVTLTCRLTKDVELRHTPSGMAVTDLRVAFTSSRKDSGGEWTDHSNYADVTVWGKLAELCDQYLAKGRRIGVDGRLEFDEWDAQDGTKRSKLKVIADSVVFLDSKSDREAGASEPDTSFVPAGQAADDDIPF